MPMRPIRDVIQNQQMVAVEENVTVREAVLMMREYRVGSVVVLRGDAIVGIFTERDAMLRVLADYRDPDTTLVCEVMTAQPTTVELDRPLIHALHMMNEGGYRHLPVADKGRAVGMVSIRDAMAVELVAFEQDMQMKERLTEIMA